VRRQGALRPRPRRGAHCHAGSDHLPARQGRPAGVPAGTTEPASTHITATGSMTRAISRAVTREAGQFVRWAAAEKLTTLEFRSVSWGGPTGIDTESRWDHARRLLRDDTLKPEDRVAGLLVPLYAQWPATISRLTVAHVHASDDHVRLRLGAEPIVLPVAVPRRTARPTHQRLPAHRTPPQDRTPPRPDPLDRPAPTRHRSARRPPRTPARRPHQRRCAMAAREQRRLGYLRRRLQPPKRRRGPREEHKHRPPLKGIQTVAIPDSAIGPLTAGVAPEGLRRGDEVAELARPSWLAHGMTTFNQVSGGVRASRL
jgi:hypothetical protein